MAYSNAKRSWIHEIRLVSFQAFFSLFTHNIFYFCQVYNYRKRPSEIYFSKCPLGQSDGAFSTFVPLLRPHPFLRAILIYVSLSHSLSLSLFLSLSLSLSLSFPLSLPLPLALGRTSHISCI